MTARPTTNVLLTGVGGQGVVLASYVLSQVAMAEGYDVKQSEVHGMAQRGGSVTSHFRFGDKVWSPLVAPGTADLLMAFEALEGLRYVTWLKPTGVLVYNAQRINPSPVSAGLATYPEDIDALIKAAWPNVKCVNANALASQAGTARLRTWPCSAPSSLRYRSLSRPGKRSSAGPSRRRPSPSTWRPSASGGERFRARLRLQDA